MKGIIGTIAVLIAIGLILRFGRSSHALAQDFTGLVTNTIGSLTLAGTPGYYGP